MSETKTLEIFLAVDVDGDWKAGSDENDAVDNYQENIGCAVTRVIKVNVTLTIPKVSEASVTVPDEAGQTVTAEVAS